MVSEHLMTPWETYGNTSEQDEAAKQRKATERKALEDCYLIVRSIHDKACQFQRRCLLLGK